MNRYLHISRNHCLMHALFIHCCRICLIHLNHIIESLLKIVVNGFALELLCYQLVLQLVNLKVDPLNVHLSVLGATLGVLKNIFILIFSTFPSLGTFNLSIKCRI